MNNATTGGHDWPATFGRFRAIDFIGGGRLGPVFRARDDATGDVVALKLFTLDVAPDAVGRLVEHLEAIVAADLVHPTIVRPLAAGIADGHAYLIHEYIAARSLDQMLRSHFKPSIDDALRMATEIAGAIDFAAVCNIHHLSLQARDVFLSDSETRVTGFGIVQALRVGTGDRYDDIKALAKLASDLLADGGLSGCRSDDESARRISYLGLQDVFDGAARGGFESALGFVAALMTALGFDASPVGACDSPDSVDIMRAQIASSDASEAPIEADVPAFAREPFSPARANRLPAPPRGLLWAALLVTVLCSIGGAAATYRKQHDHHGPRQTSAQNEEKDAIRTNGEPAQSPANQQTTARTPAKDSQIVPDRAMKKPVVTRPAESIASVDAIGDASGMIFVDSQPRGASVFVDDKLIGTSPVAVPEMAASREHAVRVEIEGYGVWASSVRVRPNRINRIVVPLEPR